MEQYNPEQCPDRDEWLALDEDERIILIQAYHVDEAEELGEEGAMMHALIHTLIENQIAIGTEQVSETISRLIHQGLNRHEAIHAVGTVVVEDIYNLLQKGEKTWDQVKYRKRLKNLTAKRWRRGKW